jgi:hypothetical protein
MGDAARGREGPARREKPRQASRLCLGEHLLDVDFSPLAVVADRLAYRGQLRLLVRL